MPCIWQRKGKGYSKLNWFKQKRQLGGLVDEYHQYPMEELVGQMWPHDWDMLAGDAAQAPAGTKRQGQDIGQDKL